MGWNHGPSPPPFPALTSPMDGPQAARRAFARAGASRWADTQRAWGFSTPQRPGSRLGFGEARRDPARSLAPGDLGLVTAATQGFAPHRQGSGDERRPRATSGASSTTPARREVREAAREHGLRRPLGELLVARTASAMKISAGFAAGLLVDRA